jgi:hypothetical protein
MTSMFEVSTKLSTKDIMDQLAAADAVLDSISMPENTEAVEQAEQAIWRSGIEAAAAGAQAPSPPRRPAPAPLRAPAPVRKPPARPAHPLLSDAESEWASSRLGAAVEPGGGHRTNAARLQLPVRSTLPFSVPTVASVAGDALVVPVPVITRCGALV